MNQTVVGRLYHAGSLASPSRAALRPASLLGMRSPLTLPCIFPMASQVPPLRHFQSSSSSSSSSLERYTSTSGDHSLASLSRIDLAFVIDCTSSMQPYIHSAAQVAGDVLVGLISICSFITSFGIHPWFLWL
jgi:hypothetical protein